MAPSGPPLLSPLITSNAFSGQLVQWLSLSTRQVLGLIPGQVESDIVANGSPPLGCLCAQSLSRGVGSRHSLYASAHNREQAIMKI